MAGYTAPVDRWVATTIGGLSTEPVELQGYFSQTYRPEHHNFEENFLFDPHLEEGIAPACLAEWDTLGIRALIQPAFPGPGDPPMRVLTTDGRLVDLATVLP